jgi:uncharacterized protein
MPADRSGFLPPRIVLITGASAGLGAALARELAARQKASALVLTARRRQRLDALTEELKVLDSRIEILPVAADLADPTSPERLVAETIRRFGGLDVLINNAGLGLPTLFADGEVAHLRSQLAVNFAAPLMLARQALPWLIARKGMIINIGSSITCVPNSALGAYGATKAGLAYWNHALRRELRSLGVTVCLVEPGPITTEFSEAVSARVCSEGRAHPVLETPSPWMTADVHDVARRIVRLIDRPRRRLSVRRRIVWPFRVIGLLFQLWPALGDLVVTKLYCVDHGAGVFRELGDGQQITHDKKWLNKPGTVIDQGVNE